MSAAKPRWQEEPVARRHARKAFDCGDTALNDYLRRYALQNHRRGASKTFVAVDPAEPNRVLGYYTIAPASVAFARVPEVATRGMGRYEVPAFRLARLAVGIGSQGLGLGGELLLSACLRAMRVATEVGGRMLIIDAKSERAATWYEKFGAIRLEDDRLQLVLPFATVRAAIRVEG